jgi:hypothetical protein
MDYTGEQLRESYFQDEVYRLAAEHSRLFELSAGPSLALAARSEVETAQGGYAVSAEDIDGARQELAGRMGLSADDVLILTGGSTLEEEIAAILALSEEIKREEEELGLAVSAEERDRLADKGKGFALPGGHFPVHDAKHLAAAKAFFKQGKHAGFPAHVVKAHINKAAERLGLPGLDDDDHEDDDADREAAKRKPASRRQETPAHKATHGHATRPVRVVRRGQRVAAEAGGPDGGAGPSGGDGAAMSRHIRVRNGGSTATIALTDDQMAELGLTPEPEVISPVDRIMRRHGDETCFVGLGAGGDRRDFASSFALGTPTSFKPKFEIHDTGASQDGETDEDGGDTDAIVDRLMADHPAYFGQDKPYGANFSSQVKTVGQRRLEEARANTGPENRIER